MHMCVCVCCVGKGVCEISSDREYMFTLVEKGATTLSQYILSTMIFFNFLLTSLGAAI